MIILAVFSGLAACSKEKKTERSLLKKEGVWDISNYHLLIYNSEDSLIQDNSHDNYGTFSFHKDGAFEWENTGENPFKYEGNWMNTDDEIMIALDDFSYHGPDIFKIIEQSKNEMTLQTITKMPDIVYLKIIETYRIKRRD